MQAKALKNEPLLKTALGHHDPSGVCVCVCVCVCTRSLRLLLLLYKQQSDESPASSLNGQLSAGGIHVTACLCTMSVWASSCAFPSSAWGSQHTHAHSYTHTHTCACVCVCVSEMADLIVVSPLRRTLQTSQAVYETMRSLNAAKSQKVPTIAV